ncbi:MAG: 4Fe-4S binding protein [Oligoflexia bacterium]|nr:4Fe-4S binding protein [Oligoflexia bacterium]
MIPTLKIGSLCTLCDSCRLICPENAIIFYNNTYTIDPWSCTLCNICVELCPVECIRSLSNEPYASSVKKS